MVCIDWMMIWDVTVVIIITKTDVMHTEKDLTVVTVQNSFIKIVTINQKLMNMNCICQPGIELGNNYMNREIKYYVIGGQYEPLNHGGAYTLEGAKRLATKHEEYWDNWQGWNKPDIYKADDCVIGTSFYGTAPYPDWNAVPYMIWNYITKKWEFV